MSNLPKLEIKLKVHHGLLKSGIQAQIVELIVDQLRAYLGSELPKHSRDIQIIVDICRAIERCGQKIDKLETCILVMRALFPGSVAADEAGIFDLKTTIDTLHSLGLFDRKAFLFRIYQAIFGTKKKE